MANADRATWVKRIAAWKASGQRAEEFAPTIGVKPRTLSWWGWHLRTARPRTKKSEPKAAAITVTAAPSPIPPLTFVEMTGAVAMESFEVVLRNGLRVRVAAQFDERGLVRLLEVLERR